MVGARYVGIASLESRAFGGLGVFILRVWMAWMAWECFWRRECIGLRDESQARLLFK